MKSKKKKVEPRPCLVCRLTFKPKDNLKAGKYCSHTCYWRDMKNRRGKKSSAWKGEDVNYDSIHKWLTINYEKPKSCNYCGKEKEIQWSNISGDYNREREDYLCLCRGCHAQWDRLATKKWRTQKNKKVRLCAIDFDGTICNRKGIPRTDDFNFCLPVDNSLSAIKWMISVNIEPYVFTNRKMWEWGDIVFWLKKHGFPGMMVTSKKKNGTFMYIDDRCYRFTNWIDICKLLG